MARTEDLAAVARRIQGKRWVWIERPTLRALDRLEGHPDYYRRQTIATPYGDAFIYVLVAAPQQRVVIASGCWPAAEAAG